MNVNGEPDEAFQVSVLWRGKLTSAGVYGKQTPDGSRPS